MRVYNKEIPAVSLLFQKTKQGCIDRIEKKYNKSIEHSKNEFVSPKLEKDFTFKENHQD